MGDTGVRSPAPAIMFLSALVATATAFVCACGGGGEAGEAARVVEVTDGDTFKVELPGGVVRSVRLVGVDAPDFGKDANDRDLSQCNAGDPPGWCDRWREAWKAAHGTPTLDIPRLRACHDEGLAVLRQRLVPAGVPGEVALTVDQAEGETDDFGRLLRYIERDGEDISTMLVRNGYAIVFDPSPQEPCDRCEALLALQAARIAEGGGCIWAD